MKHRPTSKRRRTTKSVLRLLDLEHAKSAVLNSLSSLDAQRGYRHAIDEFVDWYCSEPRLALHRTVIGLIWSLVNSPQELSIYAWVLCAVSRMRQPIVVC